MTAARLVSTLCPDEDAGVAGHEPLRMVCRRAADHADRESSGAVFGNGQQLRHRLEWLAEIVLIEAGDNYPLPAIGERAAHRRQLGVEELPLVDSDDLGIGQDLRKKFPRR